MLGNLLFRDAVQRTCKRYGRIDDKTWYRKIAKNWQLYALILLPVIYIITFAYIPMFGIVIAFKNFRPSLGILGSPWAGIKYFDQFFQSPVFWQLIKNTITISLYSLIAGFPAPIILALGINEVKNSRFKKTIQTITYAPHFISTVVMVGIILQMLQLRYGAINLILQFLGLQPVNFMGKSELFQSIYVWSGIWQNTGYAAVIYIAALSNIDISQYEAAIIDGASKFNRMLHIDIPGIMPTIIIMLILSAGGILNVGFEKIFLMQNPLNLKISEVISTYVYKVGIGSAQYSFSAAVGVFNSTINFALLILINKVAKKIGDTRLF